MMEITVRNLGNVQFEAGTRGHRVICDQPPDNGGADQGMTPPELLLASLGACSAHYAAQYLKTRNLPASGLEVTVRAEKLMQPARVGQFHLEIFVPDLDSHHEAGILRAVKACLIHNTLLNVPSIEAVVRTAAQVPAR